MKQLFTLFLAGAVALSMFSCSPKNDQRGMSDSVQVQSKGKTTVATFGKMPDGTSVSVYTLTNSQGMTMKVINYGGIITSLTAPDRNGNFEDVVLGYDSLSGYLKSNPYFGAIVGRYGNRIAKGQFTLEGKTYTLARNNNGNHLHGGIKGFDKVIWNIAEHASPDGQGLRLTYQSKDMEEGYPGNLDVEVTYTLTEKNELKIAYRATTDKTTIINLTQHSYFNLSGNVKTDILQHELMLNADQFVPVDKTLIPQGGLRTVSETPFDFKTPTAIGARIDKDDEQLILGGGYDHCWVLQDSADSLTLAATLHDPSNGRVMSVYTTEPGIQFYSGNFLDGSITGKQKVVYNKRQGLCLETEHFPDSPNQKSFPSVILKPGETYSTQTVYAFSTK
jgi:aldose 1-epimerase